MRARTIPVYLGVPLQMAPRAEWVLRTLLAVCGAAPEPVYDAGAAPRTALAYAPEPVPGVPTIPASPEALDLLMQGAPLPAESFHRHGTTYGPLVGAFPVGGAPRPEQGGRVGKAGTGEAGEAATVRPAGFALPFDLVASAFVLLACWDEYTSLERDQHGRFPYSASVFAANPALRLTEPLVDRYLEVMRLLVSEGLAGLDRGPLQPLDWASPYTREGDRAGAPARFALALTHDVDGLKRWTARGWLAAGKRTAGALRTRNWSKAGFEVGGVGYGVTRDIPRGRDPYWTFPDLLAGEDRRGVSSTFYVIASHGHPTDGIQPGVYHRRLPSLLRLLRDAGREIGLHGNDRDRLGGAPLSDDRATLAEKAQVQIAGIRMHYLRCLYHETLPLLDEEGFTYDTSLAFAEREGFRCGFSFPFHPYDIGRDRALDLVELPLVVMDSSLQEQKYRGLDAPHAAEAAQATLEQVRRSCGGAAILWHHNRFHPYVGRGYGDVYWQLVDWALEEGAALLPAGELVRRYRERAGELAL